MRENNVSRDKYVAVEFAWWMQHNCFYNIRGYCLWDVTLEGEFQVDELFDYWYESIFEKTNGETDES